MRPFETYLRYAVGIIVSSELSFLLFHVYVVVQFYPWLKFYLLLFLGIVIYDNESETKEKKI